MSIESPPPPPRSIPTSDVGCSATPAASTLASFKLAGRRALVTGSSRGIGSAIALGLAEAGANVAIHFTGNAGQAHDIAERAAAFGVRTGTVQADLGADDGARRAYDGALAALDADGIDILVLNASVQIPRPDWLTLPRDEFEQQINVNLRSSLELCQLAAPGMIERRWGRILTIGSVQESRPHPHMVVYAATKCAQTSLAFNLARQLAPHGITCNNLAPGVILTDRNIGRLADEAYAEKVRSAIPVADFGTPADCTGAALLLCSDAGRYITGQNLYIDGGLGLAN
ncbi:SDR family oxidoreductase [Opitutaceae bacterium TAV3]|nr:SDR family oxidoreductase [Opitutaceae bacterium TAV3]